MSKSKKKDYTVAMENAEASVHMEGCQITPEIREQCEQVLGGKATTSEVLKKFSEHKE